jgi:hypothetical protein
MDPVSRRLAAAAMGLAFGLSRDEELEKTRLDLERARMEREDFRQGSGPNTYYMHCRVPTDSHYKFEVSTPANHSWKDLVFSLAGDIVDSKQVRRQLEMDYADAIRTLKRCKHSDWCDGSFSAAVAGLKALGEDSSESERSESEHSDESQQG